MRNLLLLCLLLPALLPAQPDSLYVNGQSFAEIIGPVIEVRPIAAFRDFPRIGVQIDYGQDCQGKGLLACRRLMDAMGAEVRFASAVAAINWFEVRGWCLFIVSDDEGIPRRYFFRRAETD